MGLLQMFKFHLTAACALAIAGQAQGFTQVTISTGAPLGLETQFLAATQAQFLGVLTPNPLAANTYSLKLYGVNPAYNPAPNLQALFDTLMQASSYTYVYGWADGESYQRYKDAMIVKDHLNGCPADPTFWATNNLDPCLSTLSPVMSDIYDQLGSSVTVVPGDWQ